LLPTCQLCLWQQPHLLTMLTVGWDVRSPSQKRSRQQPQQQQPQQAATSPASLPWAQREVLPWRLRKTYTLDKSAKSTWCFEELDTHVWSVPLCLCLDLPELVITVIEAVQVWRPAKLCLPGHRSSQHA